ncbi:MAG: hypothetical protein IT385_25310 [Deltaproteobacteria bacterium]|nr:hypothetical protein [Deltaproteobacteria bacterium]
MKTLLLVAFVVSGACYDDVWIMPESVAKEIVREELEARGVDAGDTTRVVADLPLCVEGSPCRTVTLALDGWDEVERVGFAYILPSERGGLPHDVRVESDEADALQVELDAREEAEGIIVVFRRWAHETEYLARSGFRSSVESKLDARGLTE